MMRSDEGRGVVVFGRSDYMEKRENILNGKIKVKLLNRDPSISREKALTLLRSQMKSEDYSTKQE